MAVIRYGKGVFAVVNAGNFWRKLVSVVDYVFLLLILTVFHHFLLILFYVRLFANILSMFLCALKFDGTIFGMMMMRVSGNKLIQHVGV